MGRKMKYSMEELKDVEVEITEKEFKLARSIARRYWESSCRRLSSEDIEQEILKKLVIYKKVLKLETGEEPEENLSIAKAVMENMAKDLYRKDSREKDVYVTMDMNSTSQKDVGQEQAESVLERMGVEEELFEEVRYSDYEMIELLTKFMKYEVDDRVKYVVVAMGYINGGLEILEKPYKELLKRFDEEELAELNKMLDNSKGQMTNNIAYKMFAGLKTGVNSGSAWKIREGLGRLRKIIEGEDIRNIYPNAKEA